MRNSIRNRLSRLEAFFGIQKLTGLTLAWWKENNHRPLEEWPITDDERAAIRARREQADETMRLFEDSEDDHHVD